MEDPFITREVDAEYMAEFFIRDITEGIQGTSSKAA
jgi:predicted metal-dependent phosphotriesterase family hydrolase